MDNVDFLLEVNMKNKMNKYQWKMINTLVKAKTKSEVSGA